MKKLMLTKEELTECLNRLDITLKNDLEDIEEFDRTDLYRLVKSIIISLYNLKKYDSKTLKLSKKLDLMHEKEVKLNRQSYLDKEMLIEDMSQEFKKILATVAFYSVVSSENGIDFLRKLSLLLAISFLTFNLNLKYFTSETRKQLIKKRLSELETNIKNQELYFLLYQKIDNCFSVKLDTQYRKLLELYPEINEEEIKIKRR